MTKECAVRFFGRCALRWLLTRLMLAVRLSNLFACSSVLSNKFNRRAARSMLSCGPSFWVLNSGLNHDLCLDFVTFFIKAAIYRFRFEAPFRVLLDSCWVSLNSKITISLLWIGSKYWFRLAIADSYLLPVSGRTSEMSFVVSPTYASNKSRLTTGSNSLRLMSRFSNCRAHFFYRWPRVDGCWCGSNVKFRGTPASGTGLHVVGPLSVRSSLSPMAGKTATILAASFVSCFIMYYAYTTKRELN